MHNWSEIWLPRLAAWVNLRHVLRCVHAMRHRHRPAHCFLSMGASLFSRTLANLDICAREIWAGKENVYQLEVKINSTITLYTAFYMFSRSVWRHLAPTIPLVHAVGTAGNMCLPGVCRYCRFQCMTRSALALSSLLLWDIHWSFLSPPTPHSHEPSSPPRQTTSEKNIYRKHKKKCTVGTRGGSPFSLRRSASAKSVLVRPALPGTALLKILRTATSASSRLWKQLSQCCHSSDQRMTPKACRYDQSHANRVLSSCMCLVLYSVNGNMGAES